MFARIGYTLDLMKASWEVLKKDKELLLFPLLSAICCLIVIASFVIPLVVTGYWEPPAEEATAADQVAYYAMLFLFYFVNYFVIIFFNSAIVACAVIRLRGGDPTVGDGIRAAMSRLPVIAGWALISATVGLILRIIEDRSKKVGQIVAALLGTAWAVMTYLAVPVLVIEKTGPIETFKRSTALLKNTWGEQLVGGFAFGVVFFFLSLPAALFVVLGFVGGSPVTIGIGIGVAVLYLILLGLIQSALKAIFQAALYLYAHDEQPPEGFDAALLGGAIQSK